MQNTQAFTVTVYTGHGIKNYQVQATNARAAGHLAAEMLNTDSHDIFQVKAAA